MKNLNVWADGGVIVTNDNKFDEKLRLLRNHGMIDRDTIGILGCNSRLDTIQAVVGNWLIPQTKLIAQKRIKNAAYLDKHLGNLQKIIIPRRPPDYRIVYHLYIVFAEQRDKLLAYCLKKGIQAKIHYPVPIYRQPALDHLGHKLGDYPVTDEHAEKIITFPCDQHLSKKELNSIIKTVTDFYRTN